MALPKVSRNSSDSLLWLRRWVADLGPWAGLVRIVARAIGVACRHLESACKELEDFARVESADLPAPPAAEPAPAVPTLVERQEVA